MNCYFIGYFEDPCFKFYDPTNKPIFESGNTWLFEDVEFAEGDTIRDFIFEEEYVNIPKGIIRIDQSLIPDFV